jgi:hypothetical protein
MLEASIPLAVALSNNNAVKAKVEPDCNSNSNVAHAKDLTQPAQDGTSPFSVDGSTKP